MRRSNQKEDLTAKLLATFKQLISEGTLVPGARLPAEREMASNLNVSRGSLRQVLKMLEIMGVVSQQVGDGTYLNAAAPSILAEPMQFLILLDGISFDELMEARHKNSSIRAELEYLVSFSACALPVRQPDAAVSFDPHAMGMTNMFAPKLLSSLPAGSNSKMGARSELEQEFAPHRSATQIWPLGD